MKKTIILSVLIFSLIALGVAALLVSDYGYVLITSGSWTFENSLTRSIVIAAIPLILLYFAIRGFSKIWRLPSLFQNFLQRRKSERARRNITRGLIELTEGHWHKAELVLTKDIANADTPLLNYLLAARAAQQQDADDRRDRYLRLAHETTPKADIAIGLTQAELQMAHTQTEQALATLTHLRQLAPKHPYLLKLLSTLYVQLNEWGKLADLLPEIRKRGAIQGRKLQELERTTYSQFLRFISRTQSVYTLDEQWKSLPKAMRADVEIFRVYIDCLLQNKQWAVAERQLRGFLGKQWDENLVLMYSRIETAQPKKLLDHAETWLKDHGRSPKLLLSLGRLCSRLQLWGKARVYFETSLAVQPTIEAYSELAELLESLGERDSAHESFRKGLALAISRSHDRRTSDQLKPTMVPKLGKQKSFKPEPSPAAAKKTFFGRRA
ncbi:MAG TPA: heme biosynthesis HemY N-terminal domain-containing protein [Gammaproteobacteria bacterium]